MEQMYSESDITFVNAKNEKGLSIEEEKSNVCERLVLDCPLVGFAPAFILDQSFATVYPAGRNSPLYPCV